MDILFQPLSPGSTDAADVLIVGFADGTIHLSIYDSFDVGSFNLKNMFPELQNCMPILHASHSLSTTHSLLVSGVSAGQNQLFLVPLDLRLISKAGRYLCVVASKSNQLKHLLRYIEQIQRQMYSDFKASQDLPRRFIQSIEETLQEQSDCNWTQAAYHMAVTGHCLPEVKEWLVDQLGERVRTLSQNHVE